ncbi:MAG: hypothetical protein HC883_03490 [Bdellovibrionaceae bacterium]|nr:hypothetical protein [Pseudobdellovibrionaceae bacterium]
MKVQWKGSADTPVQFYGYTVDLGAKFTLPLGFFQPWIGGGYGWGVLTYSNPEDREFDNFMIAIYSRGSRSTNRRLGWEVSISLLARRACGSPTPCVNSKQKRQAS